MTTLSESQKRRYIAEGNKNKQFKKLSEVAKEQAVESIMTTEYLDLRCDWAFKYVLRDPELLLILLNDFLPEKIVSVTSVNTEPKRLGGKEKNVLMDIVAKAKDGREIVIEMQRFEKTNFRARMFYYGSSMVRSQLPKGKDYSRLKPVYVICFMDFKLAHPVDRLVYKYKMKELDSDETYGDWLSIYFCELPRMEKESMSEMDYVEGWFHILRKSSNFAGKPKGMDRHFDRVVEAAEIQKLPEDNKMDYFKAMISDKERLEYGEDRYNVGLSDGILKMSKQLLDMGYPVSEIARASGLSETQIAQLKEEQ